MKKKYPYILLILAFAIAAVVLGSMSFLRKSSENGTYRKGTWKTVQGKKYYYSGKGNKAVTGWAEIDGKTYYFHEDGSMACGWTELDGETFYFQTENDIGVMARGTVMINEFPYYFLDSGILGKGWINVMEGQEECSYYANRRGILVRNRWTNHDGETVYLGHNGKIVYRTEKGSSTSKDYNKIFMLGDSRFYRTMVNDISQANVTFVSEPNKGYDWLYETAYGQLCEAADTAFAENPDQRSAIVMNLGVNDLWNVDLYLEFVRDYLLPLAQRDNCDFYYVSVNPVCESKFGRVGKKIEEKKMADVLDFNEKLQAGLPAEVTYIDTCTWLTDKYTFEEMTVSDGVHYELDITGEIFDWLMCTIKP